MADHQANTGSAERTSSSGSGSARWLALESNPEVMNQFAHSLGVPKAYAFCDVYGLDPELLQMVPQPCKAVLFLFPITEKYENYRKQEEERIRCQGQVVSDKIFFMRQHIANACGTFGILHALGNNVDSLQNNSPIANFFERTKPMDPEERCKALEDDDLLAKAHDESAQGGQTETPALDANVDLHFVCFVEKDGCLYELDGRKPVPINHGPVEDNLLSSSAAVIKEFISRENDVETFNVIALAPNLGG